MLDLTAYQRFRLSGKLRQEWYLALAKTSEDGLQFNQVLEDMAVDYAKNNDPRLPLVKEMLARARSGGSARGGGNSSVGRSLVGLVPDTEATLVDAGESSVGLAQGFIQAAEYVEQIEALNGQVTGPLKEPAFLGVALIGIMMFYSIKVLPTFAGIAPRASWPHRAQVYGTFADNVVWFAVGLLSLIAIIVAAYKYSSVHWVGEGRMRADKKLWPFTLAARVNASSLLTSLAGFSAAGVKFDLALLKLSETGTPYMKSVYASLRRKLSSGESPSEALIGLHIMPNDAYWKLRVYGRTSSFEDALSGISKDLLKLTIEKTKNMFGVINLMLKAALAGYVIWTMVTMFDIVGAAKNNSTVHAMATPLAAEKLIRVA